MAAQGSECAIHLFGEHGAGEFMRKGHGRKREQQIGARFPKRRQAIVTTDEEDEILAGLLGCGDQIDEAGAIQSAAGGIEKDLAGGSMAAEEIEPLRRYFAHFASGIARGTLDELGRNGIGVGIARLAYEIKMQAHAVRYDTAMRLLVLMLCAASILPAADTLQAFGKSWTVVNAADWSVTEPNGEAMLSLVKNRGPLPGPRRPIQFAIADTPAFRSARI